MFEFVRTHNKLFQILLMLLILPSFAFFGVQSYSSFMSAGNTTVALVDGHKVSRTELDNAQREQIDRARRQNPSVDVKLFETPEARLASLNQLLRERVMQVAAAKSHLSASTEHVVEVFKTDPQFAGIRNPDGTVNKGILAMQGMSSALFIERLRQELAVNQVMRGVGVSGVATVGPAAVAFDALLQQREIQLQRFAAADFASQVKPTDAEIEAFYKDPANAARFELPESAKIEYLVLDANALAQTVTVSEADARKFYEDNKARYSVPEERRASHILIKADKSAPAAEREKAKARAEALLAEARKNPAGFAELARKNSQDEISAANGGDLEFFAPGGTVQAVADAAYALKGVDDLSQIVESDFGYHIVKLTGLRGGDKKPFEVVRAEIEGELRKQAAGRRYTELAEQFTNLVYEQSDSLKPAADKLGLSIQTAEVLRKPAPGSSGVLVSTKLLDAIFGNDALNNKRNTEALEVAPNQLVSAHVLEHHPVRLQPFADVREMARELLVRKRAAELAVAAGKARVEALKKGEDGGLGEPQVVSRAKPGQLPRPVLQDVLKAATAKLPATIGVDAGDGSYFAVRINKILARDPAVVDAKRAAEQYAQAWTAAETQAYYDALKTELKVSVKTDAMEAASAPAK